MRKNCSSDREKLLKFEAEGREFAKFLRSIEQLIQTVKGSEQFLVTYCYLGSRRICSLILLFFYLLSFVVGTDF